MKRYVVDASVILVGLLESRKSLVESVRDIFSSATAGEIELISSKFLIMEVANGIRFNERDVAKAQKFFKGFLDLHIRLISLSKTSQKESLFLSYKLGTTVYDTSYHVLAKAQSATFLTCDEEYYKKAKGLGDIELLN